MCLLKYSTILTGKSQTLLVVETSTLNFAISSALLEPSLSIMLGHRAEPLCSRSPASLDEHDQDLCRRIFYNKSEKILSVQILFSGC